MKGRHLDGEGEEIINKGIQELVRHGPGWHVGYALQSVVDVQGWYHHQETVSVD